MTAIAIQHREKIIEQVAKGAKLTAIAKSLGLSTHSAISNILADDPEFKAAREVGAHVRIEDRETEMEGAADAVTVARARELLSHARWRAEREFPARWGNKTQIDLTARVTVEHTLKLDALALLDQVRGVADTPASPIDGESMRISDSSPTGNDVSD